MFPPPKPWHLCRERKEEPALPWAKMDFRYHSARALLTPERAGGTTLKQRAKPNPRAASHEEAVAMLIVGVGHLVMCFGSLTLHVNSIRVKWVLSVYSNTYGALTKGSTTKKKHMNNNVNIHQLTTTTTMEFIMCCDAWFFTCLALIFTCVISLLLHLMLCLDSYRSGCFLSGR